jgi:uncharacterized protein YgiM (DUF1202 family)
MKGNRFVVSTDKAPFYKHGPAQAYGPDTTLTKGQKLTMVFRKYGFSEVRLDDGQTGYVATDNVTQVPLEVATKPPVVAAVVRRSRPKPIAPERGLDLNDTPAAELPE